MTQTDRGGRRPVPVTSSGMSMGRGAQGAINGSRVPAVADLVAGYVVKQASSPPAELLLLRASAGRQQGR
jgi:hypothetical protein